MRRLLAASVLLLGGCAVVVAPVVAPIAPHPIAVGLNDGWHGPLPPDIVRRYCDDGGHPVVRTPQISHEGYAAYVKSVSACPQILTLLLVEGPDVALMRDLVADVPPMAVELGNELELPPYNLSPSQYATWIARATEALKRLDYRGDVVLGGVYALTPETQIALQFGVDACVSAGVMCKIGVHLYDASDADLAWLRARRWPIWVTEVGFPTRCDHGREHEQADWLAAQLARFSTVPMLERVFVYQRANGPGCSDLDTFGIEGKPAEGLLQMVWPP